MRKGIAAAEMILLMLGAVGAGGMVDSTSTDFSGQELEAEELNASEGIDQVNDAVDQLERNVGIEIMVVSMWSTKNNIQTNSVEHGRESHGTILMAVQNVGQKSFNTTELTLIARGHRPGKGDCFKPGNSTVLDPEDIYYCDTDVVFPKSVDTQKFEIHLDGSSKSWETTCYPRVSGAIYC